MTQPGHHPGVVGGFGRRDADVLAGQGYDGEDLIHQAMSAEGDRRGQLAAGAAPAGRVVRVGRCRLVAVGSGARTGRAAAGPRRCPGHDRRDAVMEATLHWLGMLA